MALENPYQSPTAQAPLEPSGDLARLIVEELHGSRGWVMLFAVIGAVSTVGLVIGGIGFGAVAAFIPAEQAPPFPMWWIGIVYVVVGAIYVLPVWRLFQLYGALNRLEALEPLDLLAQVAKTHAGFWRTIGWTFIGLMVLYGVMVAGFVIFAATQAIDR